MKAKLDNIDLKFWLGPFLLARKTLQAEIVHTNWMADPLDALSAFQASGKQDHILYFPSASITEDMPDIAIDGPTIRYVEKRFWRHCTDLTLSMDDYWQTFSSKTRSTLKRKLRKFEATAGGSVDVRLFHTPEDIETFFDIAGEISSKTYQERLYDAGLPKAKAFRQKMVALAGDGQIKAFILYLRGKPIAYLFCPVEDGQVFYQFLGFDPEYASASPGTVLQLKAFEHLMADTSCTLFDFTEGDGPHKRLFATASHHCGNVFVFPNTWKNRIVIWLHRSLISVGNLIDNILSQLKVKQRLKKLLRRQS